jgi:hypothetical protein
MPAASMTSRAVSMLRAQCDAASQIAQGRCSAACAARRQFSSTVKPGKIVVR